MAISAPTDADQTMEHQTTYGYDDRLRLETVTHRLCTISTGHSCASTSATGDVLYEYDDDGNRTRVDEDNGSASADYRYCHDALDQLTARRTGAACTSSPDETNTFDDAGNRTQAVSGGITTNFAYTAAGLLCDLETGSAANCSGGNVGSDDAGRLSAYAGYTYLYDAQGRLVSACNDADCVGSGFRRIDFAYDGAGHRTEIVETPAIGSAVTTTFRYAGDAIVAEYRGGTLYREYTTDEAGTITKVTVPVGQTGAGTYLVTWNGHGDAMALWRIETSGSLTLANSYTYSTWGLPTTATHNSIADLGFRFLYVGAADVQWDGTYGLPLLYMHARHYSPTIGRFLQPDPSRLDAQLFVYAGNGPVSNVDPSGLKKEVVGGGGRTITGPGGGGGGGVSVARTQLLAKVVKPGGGLNVSKSVARQLKDGGKWDTVPAHTILDVIRYGTRNVDPQHAPGHFMYRLKIYHWERRHGLFVSSSTKPPVRYVTLGTTETGWHPSFCEHNQEQPDDSNPPRNSGRKSPQT